MFTFSDMLRTTDPLLYGLYDGWKHPKEKSVRSKHQGIHTKKYADKRQKKSTRNKHMGLFWEARQDCVSLAPDAGESDARRAELTKRTQKENIMAKYYYAAESDKGLSMTYDSPCWMVLAFSSSRARDAYVSDNSDKAESVNFPTACKIAPQLRTETPEKAWRVAIMF
jgi:hypothetical protein